MVRMADSGASSTPSSSLTFNSSSVFHNYPLISALVAFALAQSIKFFTTWCQLFLLLPLLLLVFVSLHRGDMIYSAGNIQIFRNQIDKLLTDQYLNNNHVGAFTILLAEKNKLRPRLYQPFIFVSSLHWSYRYREKRWDPKQLIGSGGMPSSHSATVASLAITIGIQDGFNSSLFAASMIFASVVMYDAFGVRMHAGKQAAVLNQIVFELPAEHPLAETRPLRELLGHTPAQVFAGAILGFITATIAYFIKNAAGQS